MRISGFLTLEEASRECTEALLHNMAVARVEGFIKSETGYEARLDCIWDPKKPALHRDAIAQNNHLASHMIESDNEGCDYFQVSLWSVQDEIGYWAQRR
jgi:hypothetical protein